MNFPLKTTSNQIPEGASCLRCGQKVGETEGFIRLTTGAILYRDTKRDTGGLSDMMDTVFSLEYHGPHPITGTTEDGRSIIGMDNNVFELDAVEPVKGGQVDILFCSTSCLSAFFAAIVTQFDAGIRETTKT